MNYGNIKTCDIANGTGVRTTLFVSGCRHHCKGCFQPQTWDFSYGEKFTKETEDRLIRECRPSYIEGLTLLGGEPMEPENQRALMPFLRRFREELPGKTVWCYTGYLWEELTGAERRDENGPRCEVTDEILQLLDILVDGEFVEEQKSLMLKFRGSANQRIINVRQSLQCGTVILWGA